ncbi:MAG: hypothetical protein AAFO69_03235, partial [Bacteroidota bacterium]
KEKVKTVSDSVSNLTFKPKRFLPFGNFKEVVVGLPEGFENGFTLSPSFGFNLTKKFSGGVGLLLDLQLKEKFASVGYKAFIRHTIWQQLYGQVESTHHFKEISNLSVPSEDQEISQHQANLAIGLGGGFNIVKGLQFNCQVLYQVLKSDYLPNNAPLVFRAGVKF